MVPQRRRSADIVGVHQALHEVSRWLAEEEQPHSSLPRSVSTATFMSSSGCPEESMIGAEVLFGTVESRGSN